MTSEGVLALVVAGTLAGLVGTFVMDVLNILVARTLYISRIDVAMIGRMATGWAHGRFCHSNPSEMQPVRNEVVIGLASHYAIGVALSVPFVFGWSFLIGSSPSPPWALVYGIGTTVVSWFLVYPSMGLGFLGLQSPEGTKAVVSSFANHLFYGLGLAIGMAIF